MKHTIKNVILLRELNEKRVLLAQKTKRLQFALDEYVRSFNKLVK